MVRMFDHRLNTCSLFSKNMCPCQTEMERVYLVPQLIDSRRKQAYQQTCMCCNLFIERRTPKSSADLDSSPPEITTAI